MNGFSKEWDKRYKENTHMSIWPWSDLVSFVMSNLPQKENFNVLELGCGAGANIPFFKSIGANYYAIEGSASIVENRHNKYPQFKDNIIVGDFTKDIPNIEFDLIVDRASLTCNNEKAISKCLDHCNKQLAIGGKFVGIDWYSVKSSDYKEGKGTQVEDIWTRTNFTDGAFANTGRVHFSDKEHLVCLFKKFKMLEMYHKSLIKELPSDDWELATWNFLAEKI